MLAYVGTMPWRQFMYMLVLCLWHAVCSVNGHGRLIEPPSRSSMWRLGFNSTPNYEDNQLYCGGFENQWEVNGGRCGVCGDPWQGPRDNEAGGRYARGVITRRYLQNSTITVIVDLTATHKGWFEFRMCLNNNASKTVTQTCLDKHLLQTADGTGSRYPVIESTPMKHYIRLRLPPALVCTQCVLQWKYNAGNSWGTDANGNACVGCGPQEQFYGCADIAIERRDDVISHTTTSAVWCTNSTWLPEPTKVTSEDRVSSSSSHTTLASWLFAALASLPPP